MVRSVTATQDLIEALKQIIVQNRFTVRIESAFRAITHSYYNFLHNRMGFGA